MGDHALIIGGGIAGHVAAMALGRIGLECTIYEAYDRVADVGAFLTVATNGLDALSSIDAHPRVLAAGFPTLGMSLWSGSGKYLGDVPAGPIRDGVGTTTIRRPDLVRALAAESAARGIPTVFGKRLVAVEERRSDVVARFDDGTEAAGTLLVGADGIWSAARGYVDPRAPSPEYVGLLGTGGYSRGVRPDSAPGVFHFLFGKKAFFGYITREDDDVWWFVNLPVRPEPSREQIAAVSTESWHRRLLDAFALDQGPAAALIEAGPALWAPTPMHTLTPPARWHRGRVVLVGDAGHATSPSSGQGASLAIEDAVELARCLRDRGPLQDAFTAYQALREDRVMRILREARRTNSDKAAGPVGRLVRDAVLPFALRRMQTGLDWVHQHRIPFDRPIDAR